MKAAYSFRYVERQIKSLEGADIWIDSKQYRIIQVEIGEKLGAANMLLREAGSLVSMSKVSVPIAVLRMEADQKIRGKHSARWYNSDGVEFNFNGASKP